MSIVEKQQTQQQFDLRAFISSLTSISAENRRFLDRFADQLESEYGEEYSDKFLTTLREAYFYDGASNIQFKASLWTRLFGLIDEPDFRHTYESRKSNVGCPLAQDILLAATKQGLIHGDHTLGSMKVLFVTYYLIEGDKESFYGHIAEHYDDYKVDIMEQKRLLELVKNNVEPEEYGLFLRECESAVRAEEEDYTEDDYDTVTFLADNLCVIIHDIEPFYDEVIFPKFGNRGADDFFYYDDED